MRVQGHAFHFFRVPCPRLLCLATPWLDRQRWSDGAHHCQCGKVYRSATGGALSERRAQAAHRAHLSLVADPSIPAQTEDGGLSGEDT